MYHTSWVRARAACTPRATFLDLLEQIKADINEINEANEIRTSEFEIKIESDYEFRVVRKGLADKPCVTFKQCLTPNKVIVDPRGEQPYEIRCTWNMETMSCDRFVGDKRYQLWEISQRALCPWFFDKKD